MPFQLQDELPGGSKTAEDEDVGLVTSALAGVYTGLWNIPKGFFSLGAELMDLGFGTESAASVEKFLMILILLMMKQRQDFLEN